ncbi:MAG: nuclear transport factor 2 family protein [Ignavibacteria bacterium]|nr:nuclear transport factor 2 family protein [Ignavibacteria bacterium]
MKATIIISLFAVIFNISAFAGFNPVDAGEIETVIKEYVGNTDTKNAKGLEAIIYDDASIVCVNKITNKVISSDKDIFIDQVKSGKIGGWKRDYKIESIDINDETAMAKITITDSKLKQTEYLSFAKVEGEWKIVSRTYTIELKK